MKPTKNIIYDYKLIIIWGLVALLTACGGTEDPQGADMTGSDMLGNPDAAIDSSDSPDQLSPDANPDGVSPDMSVPDSTGDDIDPDGAPDPDGEDTVDPNGGVYGAPCGGEEDAGCAEGYVCTL